MPLLLLVLLLCGFFFHPSIHLNEHALRASPFKIWPVKCGPDKHIQLFCLTQEFSWNFCVGAIVQAIPCCCWCWTGCLCHIVYVVVGVETFKNVLHFRWFWHLMYHQVQFSPVTCFHSSKYTNEKDGKINRLHQTGIYVNINGIQ